MPRSNRRGTRERATWTWWYVHVALWEPATSDVRPRGNGMARPSAWSDEVCDANRAIRSVRAQCRWSRSFLACRMRSPQLCTSLCNLCKMGRVRQARTVGRCNPHVHNTFRRVR